MTLQRHWFTFLCLFDCLYTTTTFFLYPMIYLSSYEVVHSHLLLLCYPLLSNGRTLCGPTGQKVCRPLHQSDSPLIHCCFFPISCSITGESLRLAKRWGRREEARVPAPGGLHILSCLYLLSTDVLGASSFNNSMFFPPAVVFAASPSQILSPGATTPGLHWVLNTCRHNHDWHSDDRVGRSICQRFFLSLCPRVTHLLFVSSRPPSLPRDLVIGPLPAVAQPGFFWDSECTQGRFSSPLSFQRTLSLAIWAASVHLLKWKLEGIELHWIKVNAVIVTCDYQPNE